jgi:hypothetical protein
MLYAVVVPIKDSDLSAGKLPVPILDYFSQYKVNVVLTVNGPDTHEQIVCSEPRLPSRRNIVLLDGGPAYNPYSARNSALSFLFGPFHATVENVVLMDADCTPDPDYHQNLCAMLEGTNGSLLIAGRTLTKVPCGTVHFDLLRAARFECYDGFTPPDHTVGANMVIGREVYRRIGSMRETKTSGGDGCYGIDFKKSGGVVTVGSNLIVRKMIYGMSLRGIIEKQLRRACCYPEEMVLPVDQILSALKDVLACMAACCKSPEELVRCYPEFIDYCFKLPMYLGMLSQHFDRSNDTHGTGSKPPDPHQE